MKTELINVYSENYAKYVLGNKYKKNSKKVKDIKNHFAAGALLTNTHLTFKP